MDFQIGVITTDVDRTTPPRRAPRRRQGLSAADPGYADAFRARVQQGIDGSDQEKGLQAAVMALSSPLAYTANEGFLRDGAMLSIVILATRTTAPTTAPSGPQATGEDCYTRASELTPVTDMVRQLVDLKDGDPVVVSGIIGPEIAEDCGATVPAAATPPPSTSSAVQANICETDYSSIMDALGEVASGILTVFQLSKSRSRTPSRCASPPRRRRWTTTPTPSSRRTR